MTTTYILLGMVIIGIGLLWLQQKRMQMQGDPHSQAELDRRKEEIGELKNKITEYKSENDELRGKGKQLSADYMKIQTKNEELSNQVAEFKAQQKQREKDQQQALFKMDTAEKSFVDEKMRVRRADEERIQREKDERDRMWAEHENKVVSLLTDLCNQPQFAFTSYDNKNLPEDFHGSLKPDFMIDFLQQYVVFDAKVSESKNLQIYINDQVQKTAIKVKGNKKIYSTIFLIVPTVAIHDIKKKYFYEDGFTFFVIEPESIAVILAMFKKIENYEFAEAMDPKERENIVDLIAAFNYHISARNAHELGLILHGLETLDKAERNMDPTIFADAMIKKAKMRHINLNTADTKELVANPEKVTQQLLDLVDPKARITKEEFK